MAYKPHERPAKPATIDRRDNKQQQQFQSLKPVKNSKIARLDNLGIKKG